MDRTLKTQAGASLIEICITIVIISVTVLIISSFSRSNIRMNKDALSNDAAYLAAEQKIVELSKEVFNDIPVSSGDNITIESIQFTRNWTVDQSGYLLLATVAVSWNSPKGSKQITLAGPVN